MLLRMDYHTIILSNTVYPILVVCVQCPLFITLIYNYKCQVILQLYSGYVMYYKPCLKHYCYFHVCSNKYYYLLKKEKKMGCLSHILQLYSDYVMYYKPGLKHYCYFHVCSTKYYCLLTLVVCLMFVVYNPSLQLQRLSLFIVVLQLYNVL